MPRFSMKLPLGKIGPREKTWIVAWVAVVIALSYGRFFYQPKANGLKELRSQVDGYEKQKISMMARQPDIRKMQTEIDAVKEEINASYAVLTSAEENLLDAKDIDQLLDSLVRDRAKFELMLNSVRPIHSKEASEGSPDSRDSARTDPDLYRKLLVQLDIYGTFQGMVSYIEFLEKMRPYQELQNLKVRVEGQEFSRPHAVILLSLLMGQTKEEKQASREEIFALLGDAAAREQKDPFLTEERPKELFQAVGMELSGIFSESGQPVAAMINNEIYRTGQVIQGKKIVAIESNQVVLEQGNRRFVLTPAQASEVTR